MRRSCCNPPPPPSSPRGDARTRPASQQGGPGPALLQRLQRARPLAGLRSVSLPARLPRPAAFDSKDPAAGRAGVCAALQRLHASVVELDARIEEVQQVAGAAAAQHTPGRPAGTAGSVADRIARIDPAAQLPPQGAGAICDAPLPAGPQQLPACPPCPRSPPPPAGSIAAGLQDGRAWLAQLQGYVLYVERQLEELRACAAEALTWQWCYRELAEVLTRVDEVVLAGGCDASVRAPVARLLPRPAAGDPQGRGRAGRPRGMRRGVAPRLHPACCRGVSSPTPTCPRPPGGCRRTPASSCPTARTR
jgi:hypothetical protein